jgi:inosine-uridine nucleoside N-ribohydrolase
VKVFGFQNAILHDPSAVYAVAWKEKIGLEKVFVEVETKSKYCDGRTKI